MRHSGQAHLMSLRRPRISRNPLKVNHGHLEHIRQVRDLR